MLRSNLRLIYFVVLQKTKMLRKIYYFLSPNLRLLARRIFYFPTDLINTIKNTDKDSLIPPKGMIFTGSGDFVKQGEKMVGYFKEYCNIKPNDAILDIGSGIGRIAVPLTKVLDKKGRYEGFDIVDVGVNWCKNKISSRYPNFNFLLVELENDLYTSKGKDASTFKFPYQSASFNSSILTSVFTHMVPNEVDNYLTEINRVLVKGGYCFATFFILNEESKALMTKKNSFMFNHDLGHYSLMDENVKSANVAFKESYLLKLFEKKGFTVEEKLDGFWCGREKSACKDFQDIIILKKI